MSYIIIEEYDNPGSEIFKLSKDQYHPKLNPNVGNCFCCDGVVHKLLQYNCCDCGVLLCHKCLARDRYDFCPSSGIGFTCYLCRIQSLEKNKNNHY